MQASTIDANLSNVVAQELTGRDHLSYSQVSTFQSCPLKWYYRYVAHQPVEHISSGLLFGLSIHAALERQHRALVDGSTPPSVEQLLDTFETAWNDGADAPIRYNDGETAESLRDLAGRVLHIHVVQLVAASVRFIDKALVLRKIRAR